MSFLISFAFLVVGFQVVVPFVKGRAQTGIVPRVKSMKHITYAEKSLLVGDVAADLLLEYAAALGSTDQSDTVSLHAISSDGDEVEAMFLVGEGAPLMSETTTNTLPEPDNAGTETYLRERIDFLGHPAQGHALPEGELYADDYNEFQQ